MEAQNEKYGSTGVSHVVPVPTWMYGVRGFQFLIGFVNLILAGILAKASVSEFSFGVVCGVFTIIIIPYIVLSSTIRSVHVIYHVFAVLGLDFLMFAFWLSAMGSMAALRAKINDSVRYLDSLGYSTSDASKMTGFAVLAAFLAVSFVATFVYTLIVANRNRQLTLNTADAGKEGGSAVNGSVAPTSVVSGGPVTYEMNQTSGQDNYQAPAAVYQTPVSPYPAENTGVPMPSANNQV